jgi:hypothetical protein
LPLSQSSSVILKRQSTALRITISDSMLASSNYLRLLLLPLHLHLQWPRNLVLHLLRNSAGLPATRRGIVKRSMSLKNFSNSVARILTLASLCSGGLGDALNFQTCIALPVMFLEFLVCSFVVYFVFMQIKLRGFARFSCCCRESFFWWS